MVDECPDCGATFGSPAELVTHVKKEHHGGDPAASLDRNPNSHVLGLECALCGKYFATREDLAAHNLKPHRHNPGLAPASEAHA